MPEHVSSDCEELLQNYEGFEEVARDVEGQGTYTIGYGHYGSDVQQGQTITRETAAIQLRNDLSIHERNVLDNVSINLSQNQFDALVMLSFNIGESAFRNSNTLSAINNMDFNTAATEWAGFRLVCKPPQIRATRK